MVVRRGLDPDFSGVPPTCSDARRLVCVGRLCEQKGQLLLIEATRRLAERGTDLTLTLAGDLRPTRIQVTLDRNSSPNLLRYPNLAPCFAMALRYLINARRVF
jgi:glycosyltransferase involved in cell wall biosynthesis